MAHIWSALEETLVQLAGILATMHPQGVLGYEIQHNQLHIEIEAEQLLPVLQWLHNHPDYQFTQLVDLAGVDYPSAPQRFMVVYQLLSMTKNLRVMLKVAVGEHQPVPSVVTQFPCAGWYEREAYDMYGIVFAGNNDLRRLLTDYGFDGHPMRKDFPLTGYTELRYDPEQQRVVYEPVKLTQEFRRFDFVSPWEGLTNVQLPGDEKANKPLGSFELD